MLLSGGSNLALFFGITIASNTIYTALLVLGIAKLFDQEKVVLGQ